MRLKMIVISVLMVGVVFAAWTDSDGHSASVDEVVGDIRAELGLTDDEPIDADTVPNGLLETLGDAVMGEYVGNARRHEWMDRMMGGVGSEALASAHRWMGYRYLGGGYGTGSGGGMMGAGMMGAGSTGMGMMGSWGMMGNPEVAYGSNPYISPEEALKRRYVRGEIERDEYREMLEELRR